MSKKLRAGILGATGLVGQRLIHMLENHPWFDITELAASDKSSGRIYEESCSWLLPFELPARFRTMNVKPVEPGLDCDFVFSSLPSSVAKEVEEPFARAGYPVISNSSYHRMDVDVPLVIPEVNSGHIDLIEIQKRKRNFEKGFIVANPNCTTIGLALALAPLERSFGLESVQVTSMQALSGAGQTGVSSLAIIDNVIPFIGGEEEKVESETLKLLGSLNAESIDLPKCAISAQCNRVNVSDGHLMTVSVKLKRTPDEEHFLDSLRSYSSPADSSELPSSPRKPIIVMTEDDRPQPRLDRDRENGMATIIGRIRPCEVLDYKFVVLSHNTIRGAAGAAILNAELLKSKGYLEF